MYLELNLQATSKFLSCGTKPGLGDESWSAPVSIKGRKATDVGAAKNESYVYTCFLNYDIYIIYIYLSFFVLTNWQ